MRSREGHEKCNKQIDIHTDIFFSLLPNTKKTTDLSIGESLQVATPATPILLGVQRVLRQQEHVDSWRIQHQQFEIRGRLVRNRSNNYYGGRRGVTTTPRRSCFRNSLAWFSDAIVSKELIFTMESSCPLQDVNRKRHKWKKEAQKAGYSSIGTSNSRRTTKRKENVDLGGDIKQRRVMSDLITNLMGLTGVALVPTRHTELHNLECLRVGDPRATDKLRDLLRST
ncbi:hypothetical protein PanWU01x14_077010 [Parasponia andersonii]|uniref:Uncharacterized protein n=1 Tax=Parasponia andersonii TaxID=3476 RepID=A0A2P5DCH4_PARAD|nr:hypothetical protein PanWU01x14_077010 [Parasponia andersonii]